MTTATARPFASRAVPSLTCHLKVPLTSLPVRRGPPFVTNPKPFLRDYAVQHEAQGLKFHTSSRRTARPSHSAALSLSSRYQQPLLQQRSRLSRRQPWVECGSPPLRRERHSYRRFDGGGFGGSGRFGNQLVYFWRSYRYFILGGGGICVGIYVTHLEETPITRRRRFNFVSEDTEKELGEQSYQMLMRQMRGKFLPDSHPQVQVIKGVLSNLVSAAQHYDPQARDWEWELHVIADDEKNAFVVPGGKVFVHTGILPLCKNEDGLAAVLGHEISHVLLHHHAERMSASVFSFIPILTLALVFNIHMGISSFVYDLLFNYPHSRNHESEADRVGLMIMARGCYDPQEAAKFWTRMSSSAQPPQLLSTHPSSNTRFESIQKWMGEAQGVYHDSGCTENLWYSKRPQRRF